VQGGPNHTYLYHSNSSGEPGSSAVERDILMKRASWILGSLVAVALAACGERNAGDAGTTGGAGTETGSPGMTADTAPALGPMDTAMTDTTGATGTAADTAAP
jgi:hypothetical protein